MAFPIMVVASAGLRRGLAVAATEGRVQRRRVRRRQAWTGLRTGRGAGRIAETKPADYRVRGPRTAGSAEQVHLTAANGPERLCRQFQSLGETQAPAVEREHLLDGLGERPRPHHAGSEGRVIEF